MRDPLCEWGGRFMKVSAAHSRGNRYRLWEWGGRSSQLSFMKESAAAAMEINISFVRGAAAPSGYPLLRSRPLLQVKSIEGRPLHPVILYQRGGHHSR